MQSPQYQQPALDPAYAQMMDDSHKADVDAVQARMRRDTTSLTAQYGALTSGDNDTILARYTNQLAMAQGGMTPAMAAMFAGAKATPPDLKKLGVGGIGG
jgi:hypothetical protein